MMQVNGKEDSYLYVLNAAEREPAEVNVLFPTDLDLGNPLAASTTHRLPGLKGETQAYWEFSSPGGLVMPIILAASPSSLL